MTHSLTIRVGRRIIGAISQWSPSQRREVEEEFEVQASTETTGLPVDLVPQTLSGRECRINRYDTYPEIMEEVFGSRELIMLTEQTRPFTVREHWHGPARIPGLGIAGTGIGAFANLAGSLGENAVSRAARSAQADVSNAVGSALSTDIGKSNVTVGAIAATTFGLLNPDIRVYEYLGCWFTDVGRQLSAEDSRIVSVDATIVWQERRRVL
jgi:hypothetical protein